MNFHKSRYFEEKSLTFVWKQHLPFPQQAETFSPGLSKLISTQINYHCDQHLHRELTHLLVRRKV